MRDRERLEYHPARLILGLKLEEQTRLAGARFRHGGDDLSTARARKLGRVSHRLHLALAPDELGKPPSS
jgi:hypothetical protein